MRGEFAGLLKRALERRRSLLDRADTDCFRVVNGLGDGVRGVTVDQFGAVLVLSLYEELAEARVEGFLDAMEKTLAPRAIYVKRRTKTPAALTAPPDEAPVRGEAVDSLQVQERGLRFLIRPGQGLSVGLYLDARDARAWVEKRASQAEVLNLFAYTCGFSVAARHGGADRVTSIDLSRRVLDWGRENALLNQQAHGVDAYLAGDVFERLKRFGREGRRFSVVVCDPPAFSSSRSGVFTATRDYVRLAAACGAVLSPGGTFFALCNQASWPEKAFEAAVRKGLLKAGHRIAKVARQGASSLDFPPSPGQAGPLKVLRFSLG